MKDFCSLERLFWLDQEIRQDHFPNAASIAKKFEVTAKTIQRNISFFRDFLHVPIEYDSHRRGYYYSDPNYSLANLYASQEEILAILIVRNLVSRSQDGLIGPGITLLSNRLLTDAVQKKFNIERIEESFSAVWNGHMRVNSEIFRGTVLALTGSKILSFSYWSPGTDEESHREVEPHHLQYYMANWMLIAWCHYRRDWRKFALSRMGDVKMLHQRFDRKPHKTWRHLQEGGFGVFQGTELVNVILQFTPFRARWIHEQFWHEAQQVRELSDGGLELSFPVADFREVKMKILQFGADVRVIAPPELQCEIQEEIERMTRLYGQ